MRDLQGLRSKNLSYAICILLFYIMRRLAIILSIMKLQKPDSSMHVQQTWSAANKRLIHRWDPGAK